MTQIISIILRHKLGYDASLCGCDENPEALFWEHCKIPALKRAKWHIFLFIVPRLCVIEIKTLAQSRAGSYSQIRNQL